MAEHASADQEVRRRIGASFAQQGLMATLGARLDRVEQGEVSIRLPMSPGVKPNSTVSSTAGRRARSRTAREATPH